jgi:membrane-associated phospholipid phosphatase
VAGTVQTLPKCDTCSCAIQRKRRDGKKKRRGEGRKATAKMEKQYHYCLVFLFSFSSSHTVFSFCFLFLLLFDAKKRYINCTCSCAEEAVTSSFGGVVTKKDLVTVDPNDTQDCACCCANSVSFVLPFPCFSPIFFLFLFFFFLNKYQNWWFRLIQIMRKVACVVSKCRNALTPPFFL